ncbi:unnamed protein product [marine sediment metagenome]|uniref:Uncharacterized protein n=1 Tax=marine sediment metagenome TaxID=412755 RepID=X0TQT9_9ZZZZ
MIKAKSGDLYILGLSKENLLRLQQDQPILFNLSELGLKGRMAILYGETEEELTNMILDIKNKK